MAETKKTLCILGCGNLGTAILNSLVTIPREKEDTLPFDKFIACVRSERSAEKLTQRYSQYRHKLAIYRNDNVQAVNDSDVVILAVDPSDIEKTLAQPDLSRSLNQKLVISVAAGWTRQMLKDALSRYSMASIDYTAPVIRTLPNIAALVSQSLTAIEIPEPAVRSEYMQLTDSIFNQLGRTVRVPPELMDATTAVAGSTPAFFAVIVDAMIDAAVAVGMPRDMAHTMIFQSMLGSATMLQNGTHPALLKDQGTSPEGCTIGGLMVLEEAGVRGHVGRALREAVTVARKMDGKSHVNDTRQ